MRCKIEYGALGRRVWVSVFLRSFSEGLFLGGGGCIPCRTTSSHPLAAAGAGMSAFMSWEMRSISRGSSSRMWMPRSRGQ